MRFGPSRLRKIFRLFIFHSRDIRTSLHCNCQYVTQQFVRDTTLDQKPGGQRGKSGRAVAVARMLQCGKS
jgi:hypothetical protein